MAVYHILVSHFPIALWLTAYLFIALRTFSDAQIIVSLEKSIWPLILLGSLAGAIAYIIGLQIYPWSAITQSPLGRNHIMLATWTLSYWTVMGILGFKLRRHLFEGAQKWIAFTLGSIGALVVVITGTLGGSLTGTPSLVTKSLSYVGWNVYTTFYIPTWMLAVFVLGAIVLVVLGFAGRRYKN
ncbi:MAG: hypothetical protein L3J21_05970 [Devosiaceae bacterium]|nr:hypothetical protein [Devosiaceae bacterium]